MADTQTFTITAEDESTDELTIPDGLLDRLVKGDVNDAEALGDVTMLAIAQQVHGVVHHGHEEADDELLDLESTAMELFEERFGASFGEMTGHSH